MNYRLPDDPPPNPVLVAAQKARTDCRSWKMLPTAFYGCPIRAVCTKERGHEGKHYNRHNKRR